MLLKKVLQKQEDQGKELEDQGRRLEEQGTAIATLLGKVNQLVEGDGDTKYVHIESSTRADIGE